MKIQVTQNDIECGIQRCYFNCALSLAFKRHLNIRDLHVRGRYLVVVKGYKQVFTLLPVEAVDFYLKFDENKENVRPIEFDMKW